MVGSLREDLLYAHFVRYQDSEYPGHPRLERKLRTELQIQSMHQKFISHLNGWEGFTDCLLTYFAYSKTRKSFIDLVYTNMNAENPDARRFLELLHEKGFEMPDGREDVRSIFMGDIKQRVRLKNLIDEKEQERVITNGQFESQDLNLWADVYYVSSEIAPAKVKLMAFERKQEIDFYPLIVAATKERCFYIKSVIKIQK